MTHFIQALIVAVIGVILGAVIKKTHREMALLLSIAGCVVIGIFLFRLIDPLLDFFLRLRNLAGLDKNILSPVLKSVGIGLLTQITSKICTDAGENAVGSLVELCGSVLTLYVAIPLMEAVLELVEGMGGG